MASFREAMDLAGGPMLDPTHDQQHYFIHALAGLEESLDDSGRFRALCRRFIAAHTAALDTPFRCWHLKPGTISPAGGCAAADDFRGELAAAWSWQDRFGRSSWEAGRGLEIRAANGGDLWKLNVSAPRVMRPAIGRFAVQAVCGPARNDSPASGGIVIWKDRKNFFTLAAGVRGKNEISFRGCRDGEDVWAGRGRLPAESVRLRLERRAGSLAAFCSADGTSWYSLGRVDFSVADPVEIGLFACGKINRAVYPAPHPEGTAVRFESFRLETLN
jgi:regulation of enolase protein 1 (concanavalin A-like superfamily)